MPVLFSPVEAFENMVDVLRRYAASVVGHKDPQHGG